MSHLISARIPPELKRQLQQVSKDRHQHESVIIRDAIVKYLEDWEAKKSAQPEPTP